MEMVCSTRFDPMMNKETPKLGLLLGNALLVGSS
jgi:hypothetical protein